MHVATWCVIVFLASPQNRDPVCLQSVLQKVVWALGNSGAWQQLLQGDNLWAKWQLMVRRPSRHHSFRASSWHIKVAHTLVGKQPRYPAFQVSLLCSCHLFFPKRHGAQKSTIKPSNCWDRGNSTIETVRSWGTEGREGHFGCFSQDKGHLKHLDIF